MTKQENYNLGIKGEPPKGIIFEDPEEGVTLIYDPNTQFITFLDDDNVQYDQMDCSFFSDWNSVLEELYSEYGISPTPQSLSSGQGNRRRCLIATTTN